MILQRLQDINWRDQVLHALAGAAIVALTMIFIPWWIGVVVSMAVAVTREMFQHPWYCREGCRTDLLFWMSGSVLASLLFGIVRW